MLLHTPDKYDLKGKVLSLLVAKPFLSKVLPIYNCSEKQHSMIPDMADVFNTHSTTWKNANPPYIHISFMCWIWVHTWQEEDRAFAVASLGLL